MLFSAHHIHWGSPPQPVTHQIVWREMTPEQQELLARKCAKRDFYQAHLFTVAIGSAFSGKFTPLDLIDGPLNLEASDQEMPVSRLKPSQRREKMWGKWNWDIQKLYAFAKERGYDPTLYFDEDELKDLGHEQKTEQQ